MSTRSSTTPDRAATTAALLEALRVTTGLSVLFSQAVADRVGIGAADLESLDVLIREGPMSAGRLAEVTGLTTGAITGLVDRLERHGFARREPDPADRRRVIVRALPERAEADLGPLYAAMAAATEDLLDRYGNDELAVIRDFLERCAVVGAEQITRVRADLTPSRGRGVRSWARRQVPHP